MKEIIIEVPDNFGETLKPEKVNCEIKRELVRCKDCKWYDERISMCDNCGLPREQTFFCADGEKDGGQMKRPKGTFWDSLSEADLMEPMRHFED